MEVDVIQNIFSHVFDDKNLDMVYDRNVDTKEYWNSDILDESYSLIWSSDNFNKACSRLAKRCKHADETLRAPLTADILACLKFETDADVQTTNKTCRRMLFPSGFSISVENLFPCDSETDIESANSCDFLLNDSDFHGVEYEDYDFVTPGINRINDQTLCTDDSNLDDPVNFYSNPFDPRLRFEGLTQIFRPLPDIGADARTFVCNGPNFLLAFDDPSSLVCEYLGAYRNYVRHISNDIRKVTKKFPNEDTKGHREVEEIAKRNAHDSQSKTLFSKILNTKELWSNSEISFPFDEISEKHSEIDSFEVSQPEDVKNDVTEGKTDNLYADTKRKESMSTNNSKENKFLSNKNEGSTKTESDIKHSTENDLIQDRFDSGSDKLKSVDDLIDRVSRKYASQNYPRNEIHQMLVRALRNRNKSQQKSETTDEISTGGNTSFCTDEKKMVNSKLKSEQSKSHTVEADAALETTDNVANRFCTNKQDPREEDISQKNQPQQDDDDSVTQQQGPLLRYPYDSSIFWKENELDSVQNHHPNVLQPSASFSNLKPVFKEKNHELHPKVQFSPQFLLPHFQPQFPKIASRPPHQNCYAHFQGVNQQAHFHHQTQQQHQHMFKHFYQPPPVQNSFRNLPPTFHPHQPFLGLSTTSNQLIHSTFPANQSCTQNVGNQILPGNYAPQIAAPSTTSTQHFNQPTKKLDRSNHSPFTLSQQMPQEAIQPKNSSEPEVNISEFEQNTKLCRSEPMFILPCLSIPPPTLPCVPNASALHHVRPYKATGESKASHHTDPNFRLDDEIWYINGIPHQHARPIHNLHSVMPFYPYNEYKGSDVNMCGINRRIAEQVAKINQAYSESPGTTSKARLADSSMVSEAHHVTKSNVNAENCERSNTITLYPVYSTTMGTHSGNSYSRFQKIKGHNYHNDINKNNIEIPRDSYDVMIDNFKEIVITDEEITCLEDFPFNSEGRDMCSNRIFTEESICSSLRSDADRDRTNASDFPLVPNTMVVSLETESGNLPNININTKTEMRKANFGSNSEQRLYEMADPRQYSNPWTVKTIDKKDGHGINKETFTDDHETSLLAQRRQNEPKLATQQQSQVQVVERKPTDNAFEKRTGDIRCIPVLGRNRRQKENETGVRKRKDIGRKVLLQLV